jgi:hypothetical protein
MAGDDIPTSMGEIAAEGEDQMWDYLLKKYEPCTDGGDNEHYTCLEWMGACPYCGLTDEQAKTSTEKSKKGES